MKTFNLYRRGIQIGVGQSSLTGVEGTFYLRAMLSVPVVESFGFDPAPGPDILSGISFAGEPDVFYECAGALRYMVTPDTPATLIIEGALMYKAKEDRDRRPLSDQLEELRTYALRCRMYEAADWLKENIK